MSQLSHHDYLSHVFDNPDQLNVIGVGYEVIADT